MHLHSKLGFSFSRLAKSLMRVSTLNSLTTDLRNRLARIIFKDIVDTVLFFSNNSAQLTATKILKVVLSLVNKRLNRNSKE
jgi:hypothetical protein